MDLDTFKKKIIIAVFLIPALILLVKGCESSEEVNAAKTTEEAKISTEIQAERAAENATIDLIFSAEQLVVSKLKDGQSAKFKKVFVSKVGFTCGEVNSKNSFGGYSGFQRFISAHTVENTALQEGSSEREFKKTWDKFCEFETTTAYAQSEHSI